MQKRSEISSSRIKGSRRGDPTLARQVRDVLLALGGEAHRAMVIEQVARAQGHDVRRIPADLRDAVILSFESNCRDARRRAGLGFHLPFGEGSHRWGVVGKAAH